MERPIKKSYIFFLLYLSYVCIYIARLNLSFAAPSMREEGMLTAAQLGVLGSVFSVMYAAGRLINGFLGDRVTPKLLICTGLVFTGLANLTVGLIPPYVVLLVLWCVNAFAQSMLWSSFLKMMTDVYGKEQADRRVPLLVSSVSVGNIFGILLSSYLVAAFGVRSAFLVPGAMTVLMGAISACLLPRNAVEGKTEKRSLPFGKLLKNRSVRKMLLPAMFHGAMKDNISLWMAVYFLDTFGVDLEQSAWYVLLIPVVGLVGRLMYPVCYRILKNRENRLSAICFVLCAAMGFVLCLEINSPLLAAICLSLIYAFVSMINTSILSIFPLHFAQDNMVASVSGLTDFATYLGAGIASAAYGFLVEHTANGYQLMFLSWVIVSAVSVWILHAKKRERAESAQ